MEKTRRQLATDYFVDKQNSLETKSTLDFSDYSEYENQIFEYNGEDDCVLMDFIRDYVKLVELINSSTDIKLAEPGRNWICSHILSIIHYGDDELDCFNLQNISKVIGNLDELGEAIGELTSFRSFMKEKYGVLTDENDEENLDIASGRDSADTQDIFTYNTAIMAFYNKEMCYDESYEWIMNYDGSYPSPHDRMYETCIDISDPDFINQY